MDQESKGFTDLSKRILEASSKGHIMLFDEQKIVLEAVSRVQSIFVIGSAGTGKSYLLDFVVKILKEQCQQVLQHAI